ncbi:MAG: M48 family metallopeptidase [Lewinellaceae bacterium]|nr:M48 family metallopeptidase [Lewinellaceae bacterium]
MTKDQIQYGTSTIEYTLEFADRKTLGIRVHPDKTVQVIAPLDSQMDQVKEKVKKKAPWILKQQDFFLSFHPITPPRNFVSGETHLYLGRQYRLKLIESDKEFVKLNAGKIEVFVQSKADKSKIEKLLKNWYKQKAEIHFNQLFETNVPIAKKFYSGTPTLKYRWMKKRWGSCDQNGQILLNLELIKASKKSIEYVIIHELCHLVHLNHSRAFYQILEEIYPDWRRTKDALERLMV